MDRQFAEAQTLIKEKGLADKAHLLSVSFDPKNDTPAVLKNHARKLDADPKVWTFVTGDREDIDRFATNFGLTLVRGEAANPDEIGHTLRTALVGSRRQARQDLRRRRLDSRTSSSPTWSGSLEPSHRRNAG